MATIIDCVFNNTTVTNPDGSLWINFAPATLIPGAGPGTILGQPYNNGY
jgi:hypothetical protein